MTLFLKINSSLFVWELIYPKLAHFIFVLKIQFKIFKLQDMNNLVKYPFLLSIRNKEVFWNWAYKLKINKCLKFLIQSSWTRAADLFRSRTFLVAKKRMRITTNSYQKKATKPIKIIWFPQSLMLLKISSDCFISII